MSKHGLANAQIPTFQELMNPLIATLRELGGSGSINEIYERVIQNLRLSEDVLAVMHKQTNRTEVDYRLAWARTTLKKYGTVTNSSRGVWSLTKPDVTTVDPKNVLKTVIEKDKKDRQAKSETSTPPAGNDNEAPDEAQGWRTKLSVGGPGCPANSAPAKLAHRQWTRGRSSESLPW
jgi:restriction system protein